MRRMKVISSVVVVVVPSSSNYCRDIIVTHLIVTS